MPILRFKMYKSWNGRGGNSTQWSNEYFVNTQEAISSPTVLGFVTKLYNFEKQFHLAPVNFMRCVVSTYEKGDQPANGETFRVVELSGTGDNAVPAGTQAEFLALTMRVRYGGSSGRSGMKYYRGALTEAMIENGADGKPSIIGAYPNFLNTAAEFLGAMGEMTLCTPRSKAPDGLPARFVTQVAIVGASIHKMDNRRKRAIESASGASAAIKLALELAASLAVFALTKGREMPMGSRLSLSAGATAVAGILGSVIEQFSDGVDGPIPGPV
jgi:hypothetical protein